MDLAGEWSGVIGFGGAELALVLHVEEAEDGSLTALMDSPDQGAFGIPVGSVSQDGSEVTVDLPAIGASYRATMDEGGAVMKGQWTQGGTELPLAFARVTGEPGTDDGTPDVSGAARRRPQEPEPPFEYRSFNVAFTSIADGVQLAGTVTIPESATDASPVPGIVLLSGSGQRDRDQPIFGHRPFLVLADALTKAGFAVLRYDDRGAGKSGGRETLASMTSEDLARDAAAALAFLASQEGVSADRVGYIGHSEGALLAVMAENAAGQPAGDDGHGAVSPAFLVLLGGHAIPGNELMMLQTTALMQAAEMDAEEMQTALELNRRIYDLVLAAGDDNAAAASDQIAGLLREYGMPQAQIDAQLSGLLSPWYRFFLAYDPRPALRRVDAPVLALIGELDRQVPPAENLAALEQALAEAPALDVTVREIPGVNHLFQTAETGGVDEYSRIEETFSPAVIEAIVEWVGGRVR